MRVVLLAVAVLLVPACKTELGGLCTSSEECAGEDGLCTVVEHSSVRSCVTECPCDDGETCLGSRCFVACTDHSECPTATGCVSGRCIPTCESDADCASYAMCTMAVEGELFCAQAEF